LILSFGLNAKTTSLGQVPQWSDLNIFQKSMSQSEFIHFLDTVYCPRAEWWFPWIKIEKDRARVRKSNGEDAWYDLYFRDSNKTIPPQTILGGKPPHEWVVAIDPGHIGGEWAKMERREFSIGQDAPVKEGDLTLLVAFQLAEKLRDLGATSVLVREDLTPVTKKRSGDFSDLAREWVVRTLGEEPESLSEYEKQISERAELLFYRVDEIHARARLINEKIRPDLVLCLHLNAAPWVDKENRELVERNDYHVLINGAYMGGELAYDDQRFEMLLRMLSGWHYTEQLVAEKVAASFARHTPMPAFVYRGPNAIKVGEVEGVWARNLLANRIYRCPVIFLEPYVANSKSAYKHIQLGHYEGVRNVEGIPRLAMVEEYTECVVRGIVEAYSQEKE
jgi:hypothetical protein